MQLGLDTAPTNSQTSYAFTDVRPLWPREWTHLLLLRSSTMSEGTIKRLTDKGFGFIENGSGTDMFFHMSAVEGARFEELREGQKVSYNEGRGPKGPRAENVRVL
jgi:CspA family cold shock protein